LPSEPLPTTRTIARTAGQRPCCSAGKTWTGSFDGPSPHFSPMEETGPFLGA
jgi:hypothetical protein